MSVTAQVHTVKEQLAPEEHRELRHSTRTTSSIVQSTRRAIDFNIPGLPHSTVKQLHSASVREWIQKIENHPHRNALQRNLQCQQFNHFSQESKEMIHEVGNIELCELLDMEPKAQCKVCLIILGRRHRLLHVRALLAQRNGGEQEICPVHHGSPLDSQLLHKERATPRDTVTGRSQGITSTTSRIRSRRNARRRTSWVSTTGSSAMRSSARICLTSIAMKKYVVRWTNWANEDHTHHITPDEIRVYRNNWWIRSNTVGNASS